MPRRDIHVQTGLAIGLLICAALALGLTGYTFDRAEAEYDTHFAPRPSGTSVYTRPGGSITYTTTYGKYRRQATGTAGPTTTTAMATVTAVSTPLAATTTNAAAATSSRPPGAIEYSPGAIEYLPAPRTERLSPNGISAIINMSWLGLLIVYLVAFLVVRRVRPDSWFVAVAADLSFLGFFWLCSFIIGVMTTVWLVYDYETASDATPGCVVTLVSWAIITAWWIWEIVAAKRYRRGLKTSLVRLVERHESAAPALADVERDGFHELPRIKPVKIDLDDVAKEYLAGNRKSLA